MSYLKLAKHYNECFEKHGDTHLGVDWPKYEDTLIRHQVMLDLIKERLILLGIPFEYLTGKTKNREEVVRNFQENESIRVFLISLKAGGVGLNLTEADYVYIIDPWWNPAVENQAIDRSYRIGQKRKVIAVRLICPDTIEEKILLLQESKKEMIDDLIKVDLKSSKMLGKEDLLLLLD